MSEKWRNENWFTSSWNFAEEVRSSLHFSDHIKIHDVTLRDGEQQAGLIFDYKQKIALAEKLSEMGIHRPERHHRERPPDQRGPAGGPGQAQRYQK